MAKNSLLAQMNHLKYFYCDEIDKYVIIDMLTKQKMIIGAESTLF